MWKNPIKWVPLLQEVYDGKKIKCPYCQSENVEHKFCADKSDNIGFAQFICNDCKEIGHLSRVSFPAGVKVEEL